MHLKQLFTKQTGDTIVEVLIAIAVASAVLGTAYAIVNRTVESQQQTAERSEALKLAEGQLEILRAIAKTGGAESNQAFSGSPFCIDGANVDLSPPCSVGPDSRYKLTTTKSGDKFTTTVSWDSLNKGNDTVTINYKVYR